MKKKILFFAETVTMAHLIRPLKIASSLSPTEYEIHFAAAKFPELLKKELNKYQLHHVHNGVSEKDFLDAIAKGEHPYTEEILKSYVEEDLKLLREIKPDLVFGDMRLTLNISAKLVNVPYINITNSTWDSSAELPALVPDIPIVRTLGVTLTEMFFPLIRNKILEKLAAPFNATAQSFGVKKFGSYYDVLTSGDYAIYSDLKSLIKLKNPDYTKVTIGALVYSINSENLSSSQLPTKTKKRVILTLGSSGPSEKLEEMITTLSELDIELVVATGGKKINMTVKNNVILKDFLALDQVMASADLLIFNGGSGSGYLGLSQGVPLLCIPSNIDQHQYSFAVASRGAAKILRSEKYTNNKLKNLVKEMLANNSIKIAAQSIAAEMKMENPLSEISQLVETILQSGVNYTRKSDRVTVQDIIVPDLEHSQIVNISKTGLSLISDKELVLIPEPYLIHLKFQDGSTLALKVSQVWQQKILIDENKVQFKSGYKITEVPENWRQVVQSYFDKTQEEHKELTVSDRK